MSSISNGFNAHQCVEEFLEGFDENSNAFRPRTPDRNFRPAAQRRKAWECRPSSRSADSSGQETAPAARSSQRDNDEDRTATTVGRLTEQASLIKRVNHLLHERTGVPAPLDEQEKKHLQAIREITGVLLGKHRLPPEERNKIHEIPGSVDATKAEKKALLLQRQQEVRESPLSLEISETGTQAKRKPFVRTAANLTTAVLATLYTQSVANSRQLYIPSKTALALGAIPIVITAGSLIGEETTDRYIQRIQEGAIRVKNRTVRVATWIKETAEEYPTASKCLVAATATGLGIYYISSRIQHRMSTELATKLAMNFPNDAIKDSVVELTQVAADTATLAVIETAKETAQSALDSSLAGVKAQVASPAIELPQGPSELDDETQGSILPLIAACAFKIANTASWIIELASDEVRKETTLDAHSIYKVFNR
ncbi:MAG TPA: hypothetical protein VLE96_01250 [Chlamydiales bacterium]|nr:hypothetical protein [Chlamydiales bacterium]